MLVALAFALLAGGLRAQTTAISDDFAADIRKVLNATKGKETMADMMSASFGQMASQLGMTEEEAGKMAAFVVERIYPKVEVKMVELYARHFTHDEVKQLVAFYETPAGRKAGEKAPVIAAEGVKIGAGMASDIQAAVMEFMRQRK